MCKYYCAAFLIVCLFVSDSVFAREEKRHVLGGTRVEEKPLSDVGGSHSFTADDVKNLCAARKFRFNEDSERCELQKKSAIGRKISVSEQQELQSYNDMIVTQKGSDEPQKANKKKKKSEEDVVDEESLAQ